jgi:hypothetical protein
MAQDFDELLDQAAALWGIEPEYWDIWGNKQITSRQTARALLQDLGVPVHAAADLEAAVEERLNADWIRLLPPCLVIGELDQEIPVSLPEAFQGARAWLRVEREDRSFP